MNFEETYEHYTQGGLSAAGGSTEYGDDQEPYYPPRMHSSYGPLVGPLSSAWYGYENLIMRGIMNLTTQVNNLGQQLDQISQDLAHNTDLTQQTWGMNTSMLHDIFGVLIHLGLGSNQQHQPPQQHNLQQYHPYPQWYYPYPQQYYPYPARTQHHDPIQQNWASSKLGGVSR
jgi:hypothetical protein